jgi:hypothetical protein
MRINLNTISLAIALLTSLNVSIPAAMSGPAGPARSTTVKKDIRPLPLPSTQKVEPTLEVVKPINPVLIDAIRYDSERNPNGAQVRVKFEPGTKFSCDETEFEIKIAGDLIPVPDPGPGGLVPRLDYPESYRILSTYKSKQLLASSTGNSCLYNFTLSPDFVGKKAFVSARSSSGPQESRSYYEGNTILNTIRSPRQIFNVDAKRFFLPN